jgi:hypothetical protein
MFNDEPKRKSDLIESELSNCLVSGELEGYLLKFFKSDDNYNSVNYDNSWPNEHEIFEINCYLKLLMNQYVSSRIICESTDKKKNDSNEFLTGNYSGYQWEDNNGPVFVQSNQGINDDTRQPLVLVHGIRTDCSGQEELKLGKEDIYIPPEGEQGDGGVYDDKIGCRTRNPSELVKYPYYNPEIYFENFIKYYNQSENLKSRYKLFIYRYPPYKHITFNGRMFSNMLYETRYIRDWVTSKNANSKEYDNKIVILAHSMGGLVSRSMLEEFNGITKYNPDLSSRSELFMSSDQILEKLITLGTPHHGTPAVVLPWVDTGKDRLGLAGVDLYIPAARDMWWDGYDGVYEKSKDGKYFLSKNDVLNKNKYDGFYEKRKEALEEFDWFYYKKLKNNPNLKNKNDEFYGTANPWLSNLNKPKEIFNKYYYYGGDSDNGSSLNALWSNSLKDSGVSELANTILFNTGYPNDFVVPAVSSTFDFSLDDSLRKQYYDFWHDENKACNLSDKLMYFFSIQSTEKEEIQCENHTWSWSIPVGEQAKIDLEEKVGHAVGKNVYIGKSDDGFKMRFFRDYNHERMKDGAHNGSPSSLQNYIDSKEYDKFKDCQENNPYYYCYSIYINPKDGFRDWAKRQNYLNDVGVATEKCEKGQNSICSNPLNPWLFNFIKYEPLFIQLEKDLTGKLPDLPETREDSENDTPPFSDVTKGDWFFDYVAESSNSKYGTVKGRDDGKFEPKETVKKIEALKMLLIASGAEINEEVSSCKDYFTDVNTNKWYCNYAIYAVDNNIISKDKLDPDKLMSRGETVNNFVSKGN